MKLHTIFFMSLAISTSLFSQNLGPVNGGYPMQDKEVYINLMKELPIVVDQMLEVVDQTLEKDLDASTFETTAKATKDILNKLKNCKFHYNDLESDYEAHYNILINNSLKVNALFDSLVNKNVNYKETSIQPLSLAADLVVTDFIDNEKIDHLLKEKIRLLSLQTEENNNFISDCKLFVCRLVNTKIEKKGSKNLEILEYIFNQIIDCVHISNHTCDVLQRFLGLNSQGYIVPLSQKTIDNAFIKNLENAIENENALKIANNISHTFKNKLSGNVSESINKFLQKSILIKEKKNIENGGRFGFSIQQLVQFIMQNQIEHISTDLLRTFFSIDQMDFYNLWDLFFTYSIQTNPIQSQALSNTLREKYNNLDDTVRRNQLKNFLLKDNINFWQESTNFKIQCFLNNTNEIFSQQEINQVVTELLNSNRELIFEFIDSVFFENNQFNSQLITHLFLRLSAIMYQQDIRANVAIVRILDHYSPQLDRMNPSVIQVLQPRPALGQFTSNNHSASSNQAKILARTIATQYSDYLVNPLSYENAKANLTQYTQEIYGKDSFMDFFIRHYLNEIDNNEENKNILSMSVTILSNKIATTEWNKEDIKCYIKEFILDSAIANSVNSIDENSLRTVHNFFEILDIRNNFLFEVAVSSFARSCAPGFQNRASIALAFVDQFKDSRTNESTILDVSNYSEKVLNIIVNNILLPIFEPTTYAYHFASNQEENFSKCLENYLEIIRNSITNAPNDVQKILLKKVDEALKTYTKKGQKMEHAFHQGIQYR